MAIKKRLTVAENIQRAKRIAINGIKSAMIDDTPPARKMDGGEASTIRKMKSISEKLSLASMLPYESYDKENGLYYNKDTVGVMIHSSGGVSLSTDSLTSLNAIFSSGLEDDSTIQVTLIADPNTEKKLKHWARSKDKCNDSELRSMFLGMAADRVEHFKKAKWTSLFLDQPFLIRDYHLIISITVPIQIGSDDIDMDVKGRLKRIKASSKSTLRTAGLPSTDLLPDQFINIISGILNPKHGTQPDLEYDELNFINKQIIDAETKVLFGAGSSSIVHQDKAFTMIPYHVKQFPKRWAGFNNGELIGDFSNNVRRISCPYIATLTVSVRDQVKGKSLAKSKMLRAMQMADSDTAKWVPEWKDRKADWVFASQKLEDGNKLHEAYYQILLFAEDGAEDEACQQVETVYANIGWTLSKSRYIPIHSFLGALPMGLCQQTKKELKRFGHFSSRLSWTCANLSPWITEWKGTTTPSMLFFGRRGQVSYFDPYDNKKGNYNMSCCATSGSGKSFVTQEWVSTTLSTGGRAFVIDAGHSYRELCSLAKGTYIDFGAGRPNVNPFSKIFSKENLQRVQKLAIENPDEYSMDDYVNDMLPMLKKVLGVMASPDSQLPENEQTSLERAIKTASKQWGEETTVTKVVNAALEQKDENGVVFDYANSLALKLHSFTNEGMYGRYFEGKNNIDLENPFVVLELDALNAKPELQSVVLLILMIQINQVMYLAGNKSQKKLCIIDEAWRLLGRGRAGEFIEEGYRVARKHGGSFMTITQKISDYFTSETAKAAYANSDFKLYLRQDPTELKNAEKLGYITNTGGKVDLITSLETVHGQYSEIAIDSPSGMSIVRFIVDGLSEKIYSTQPADVEYIQKELKSGKPLIDILRFMASKKR